MTPYPFTNKIAKVAERKAKRKDNAKFIAKIDGKKIKPSRSSLEKQLDHLCHLLVMRRDGSTCRICKWRPGNVPYHIIPRGKKAIRWDLDNIVNGCNACNFGEKNHRLDYAQKHREIFGHSFMDALWDKSKLSGKFSVTDLVELRDSLKYQVENSS